MFPKASSQESSNCQCCPRQRRCLLKGCEKSFQPPSIWSHYCSKECAAQARIWSKIRAQHKYSRSARGRVFRARQSRERRRRRKERELNQVVIESPVPKPSCEGDQEQKKFSAQICARPGCYEGLLLSTRSPLKKYCCFSCYKALRRVQQREKYWKRLLGITHFAFSRKEHMQQNCSSHIA